MSQLLRDIKRRRGYGFKSKDGGEAGEGGHREAGLPVCSARP